MKILTFFCRAQIVHFGHMQVISNALENADRLIIIIGSSRDKRTIRNPLSFNERKNHIKSYMLELGIDSDRVFFEPMKDYLYNDLKWETEARKIVDKYNPIDNDIYLTGYKKDGTSYYLSMFPEWKELPFNTFVRNLSSTTLRKAIVDGTIDKYHNNISKSMLDEIQKPNSFITSTIKELSNIDLLLGNTQEQVNVVVSSGHVLLNKSGNRYKLPSSELTIDDTVEEISINTLLGGDTCLGLTPNILKARVKDTEVFSEPHRSERGRVIGLGAFYELSRQNKLPKISNNSVWLPLHKLKRKIMDDDHFYIVKYFTGY